MHAYNVGTQEAEKGTHPAVRSQAGVYKVPQANQECTVRCYNK